MSARMRNRFLAIAAALIAFVSSYLAVATASPEIWRAEWPRTDFTKYSIPLSEIRSGGPAKGGIPSIDQPRFETLKSGRASGWLTQIGPTEPVISVAIGAEIRAYPLRIMLWHEIVNDVIKGTAVAVTYCSLCNAALVFHRALGDQILSFG